MRNINIGIANFLAILLALTMMISVSLADQGNLSLPQNAADPVTVRFSKSAVDWESSKATDILQLYVGEIGECCEGRTPVAGRYVPENDALTFTPAFSFAAGQDYVARVRIPGADEKLVKFSIPLETSMMNATVTKIYPSGDILPENVLRFYIHFSVPMSPHLAFDYIKLRDASGNTDDAAFMRFKQELWNEDRTRLTVLIDPGRIKREVATNLELGPALRAGQRYTLSVEGGWPSADGMSVATAFSKTFTVSDALRERPDVRHWQATSPCFWTREPLAISLDRPFDRHLLSKGIHIVAGDGQIIEGAIRISDGERLWNFTPNTPWTHEDLNVVAKVKLEDVAGNNFRDLLDQAVTKQESKASVTTMTVHLERCSG